MNMPIEFNIANIVRASYQPRAVVSANNATFNFFCRYFWQKAINVFKYSLPNGWSTDYFTKCLFGNGFVTILNTNKYGVLPQWGTTGGYNFFYEPAFIITANPLLSEISGKELVIGKDCEVIKLTPDYFGICDLIGFYAEKMALASQSIDVNLINSKLAYVFAAKNKQQAEAFKTMTDKINTGNPAVVIDKSLFNDDGSANWQLFTQNLKNTYLVTDILSDYNRIEQEFDTKIGIPNSNTEKRERMNDSEVNANNVETAILADGWLDSIHRGIKRVNALYPDIEIHVEWRYKPDESYSDDSRIIQ